nr:MAG TPA: hypothetical protein [Bacteriophage sp.]
MPYNTNDFNVTLLYLKEVSLLQFRMSISELVFFILDISIYVTFKSFAVKLNLELEISMIFKFGNLIVLSNDNLPLYLGEFNSIVLTLGVASDIAVNEP